MVYTPQTWTDGSISAPAGPISAARLGHIENGLKNTASVAYNVMDYGAVNDGFTDCTTAIQNTINAAGATGTVEIPPGVYVISSALTISNNYVTIRGAGYRSTQLYLANSSNSSMIVTADDGVQRYGLLLADFALSGNAANQTGSSPAISIRGMNEARIYGLYILEPRGEAIRTGQATAGMFCTVPMISHCVIRGHSTASQTDCLGMNTGSSDAQIHDNDIGLFVNGAGVLLSGHNGSVVSNNNVWQCKYGYYVFSSLHIRMTGCLSDYAKQHGFLIAGSSTDVQLSNCQARESSQSTANTYDGFRLDTVTDVHLSNCRAMGSQQRVGHALFQNVTRSRIIGGSVAGNAVAPMVVGTGCTDYRFVSVAGMSAEAQGTATITSAATSVAVTHGLSLTPTVNNITVTATNNLGSATRFWVSNPTSSQFTINVDVAPGAATATFTWTAIVM